METPNQDAPEVLETPEVPTEPETPETPEPETPAETPEEKASRLEKENADLADKNKKLFERAKTAEQKAKEKSVDGLTTGDVLAFAKSDVHEEDMDTVTRWAKNNGQTVAEALKDRDLKLILDAHTEERRTADATQTGSPRSGSKVSGEDLLRKAEQTNEVPETKEGMQALFAARQARRFKR